MRFEGLQMRMESLVATYVLVHSGNPGMPESDKGRAEVMSKWIGWPDDLGPAVVAGGNPIMAAKTVTSDGAVNDLTPRLGGYSILEARNLSEADEMTKGSPHLEAGGDAEIYETLDVTA